MKHPIIRHGKYVLLAIAVFFPLFWHLETLAVRIWDEARLAQTAYEMLQNGNYLIPHTEGVPDMWSTKPPLMIWAIVFCMKIFGVNELAVRLPSAFAALTTLGVLYYFLKKLTKIRGLGIVAILVLVSTAGYVTLHAARTGDYDVPMTLFTTISCLAYFTYLTKKRSKYLHIFFIALTIAVLIKSVNALLFAPAILVYTIVDKKLLFVLRSKHFYIGIIYSLFFILGYYLTREHYNPGYIDAVFTNELGGRFLQTLEYHKEPFYYYIKNLITYQYSFWVWLLPFGIYIGLSHKDLRYRKFTRYIGLLCLGYMLVISSGQTKLAWYVTPIFPFLAIFNANAFVFVYKKITAQKFTARMKWITSILLISIFVLSYTEVFLMNYTPKEEDIDSSTYYTSYYLKKAIKNNNLLNDHKVLYEGYKIHVMFYISALNSKGSNIHFIGRDGAQKGDKVIVQDTGAIEYIHERYTTRNIYDYGGVSIIEIL